MKQLRYTGNNKPQGMIIEVEEKDIKRLLDSGEYEEISTDKKLKEIKDDGNNSIKLTK